MPIYTVEAHCRTYSVSIRPYTKFGNIWLWVRTKLTLPPWSKEEAQGIWCLCMWVCSVISLNNGKRLSRADCSCRSAPNNWTADESRQQGYLQNAHMYDSLSNGKFELEWNGYIHIVSLLHCRRGLLCEIWAIEGCLVNINILFITGENMRLK